MDNTIINTLAIQWFPCLFKRGTKPDQEGLDCAKIVYEEYDRIQRKVSELPSMQRKRICNFVDSMEKERNREKEKLNAKETGDVCGAGH